MPRRHILREARGARIDFACASAAADLKACGFGTYDDFVNCRMGDQVHASSLTTTRRLSLGGPLNGTVHYLKCYRFESRRGAYGWDGPSLPLRRRMMRSFVASEWRFPM